MLVMTSQYEISSKNHIFSVKSKPSTAGNNSLEKEAFWHEVKVVCCLLLDPVFTCEIDYIPLYPSDR